MVTSIQNDSSLIIDTTNFINETGLFHSFIGVKDLVFSNDEIPRIGEIVIEDKFDSSNSNDMVG